MKELLPKLTSRLHGHSSSPQADVPSYRALIPKDDPLGDKISHAYLWPRVAQFFREKDVIVAETGTSSFGVLDVPLPHGSVYVSQTLWGSIGWTVGMSYGVVIRLTEFT